MKKNEPQNNMEEAVKRAEVLDVPKILKLLHENLEQNLTEDKKKKEGFLSFCPTEKELVEIINDEGVIINTKGSVLKGYFITLSKELADTIPFWIEMLNNTGKMEYEGIKIKDYNYVLIGQICVAKSFRDGVSFSKLYSAVTSILKSRGYEIAIGEISGDNYKSLVAHSFLKELGVYKSISNQEWHVVALDLKKG